MPDTLAATRVRMLADAAALEHDELREAIARLEATSCEAETPEDDLSDAEYAWLFILQQEAEKREFLEQRERDADDGLQYADPRDEMEERRHGD